MIYIITHKKFKSIIEDQVHYKILHVGSNDDYYDYYLKDNTGDNISKKNPNYCELTGQYWIWKNVDSSADEITGLIHYRRYFTDRLSDVLYTYLNIKPKVIKWNSIEYILKKYDIIVPKTINIYSTVKEYYSKCHDVNDLDVVQDAIAKLYPEYLNDYIKVLDSHKFIYGNMFISKKVVFDDYSRWLFDILNYVENQINLDKYESDYQKRIFGFLSERLLQVWILHNNLKIKEVPIFNTDKRRDTIFVRNIKRMRGARIRIKRKFDF